MAVQAGVAVVVTLIALAVQELQDKVTMAVAVTMIHLISVLVAVVVAQPQLVQTQTVL